MDIVNWDIINEKSSHFKNAKPTKWAFTKEFLNRELYEELEQTYPKFDNNSWNVTDNEEKLSYRKFWKRDEGGYWDEAGDDITRYKIELWDNFHPKGFKVPCCRAPREGADAYEKGWKVDVLVDVNGKLEWKLGTVESSTKKKVKVIRSGSIETYDKQLVRRHKDSKYITNSFPCNLGSYGHIHPIIKQLVHQDVGFPLISSENNVGLVRKGIKRGSDIGDHSFLDSLQEILYVL